MKKNGARGPRAAEEQFAASDDPVQAIYENVQQGIAEPQPSWALERLRRCGVAGLFPGFQNDFPYILYAHSVARPAWSGKRDFHQEKLHHVYEFLIAASREEIQEPDAVGDSIEAFDASPCLPACETNVCVDALSPGAA